MSEAQRWLTTIVAADIAGFSRLVGADEEGTLAAQRGHRAELIDPLIEVYHGRIANTAGDSLLVEFPSAVEAVRCAVAMQEGMAERSRDVPIERSIQYRIGINVAAVVSLGDVYWLVRRTKGLGGAIWEVSIQTRRNGYG